MSQNKRKIQNWQIERAKARGSARLRRAAFALYAPLGHVSTEDRTHSVRPDERVPVEIGGNGAADNAAGRLEDRESAGRQHHTPTTERYMSAKPQELKSETTQRGPEGTKILNLTMRGLNPDAGAQVLRSGEPVYCGRYLCEVWDVKTEESRSFPGQFNDRFIGEFYFTDYLGQEHEGSNAWLPRRVGDRVKAKIEAGNRPSYEAGEIWCIPDPRGITAGKGYLYQPFNRQRPTRSRLWEIGVAAGIIDPSRLPPPEPQRALPRPPMLEGEPNDGEDYDPETGELHQAAAE